jgi:heterodisulfide reductase subunit B
MRDRFKERQLVDMSAITATVHPACHYYKIVAEDAIYDPDIYGGQRTAVVTAMLETIGINVADYSTWFDCCGFGFRHVLVQRDFTRSFSVLRKIETMKNEVNPDLTVTHDTGCVTSLDKSQFAAKAHDRKVGIPILSDAQVAALGTPQIGALFLISSASTGKNIGTNSRVISMPSAQAQNQASPGKMRTHLLI